MNPDAYVYLCRGDWAWDQRSEAERAAIRSFEAFSWFGSITCGATLERLLQASEALDAPAQVFLEDSSHARAILRLHEGLLEEEVALEDVFADGRPCDAPLLPAFTGDDELLGILQGAAAFDVGYDDEGDIVFPYEFKSEELLRAAMDQLAPLFEELAARVAVENRRFFVELKDDRAVVEPLHAAADPALRGWIEQALTTSAANLFEAGVPSAEDFERAEVTSAARTFYVPEALLAALQQQASAADRSLSYLVAQRWSAHRARLSGVATPADLDGLRAGHPSRAGEDRRARTLHLPPTMLLELESLARKLDCSQSRVLVTAIELAS